MVRGEARILQRLHYLARVSVSRACGFGTVAIITMMVGLSERMTVSLKAGGYSMLLMCVVLLLKALLARDRHYKRTELWLLLEPEERPRAAVAQRLLGGILRETYLVFAARTALAAAVLLVGALVLQLRHGA